MSHSQTRITQTRVAELAQSTARTLPTRPVPGRRKANGCRSPPSLIGNLGVFTAIILSLLALSGTVVADQRRDPALVRPARRDGLLIDPRPSPTFAAELDLPKVHKEVKRQARSTTASSSRAASSATATTTYAAITFSATAGASAGNATTTAPTGLATENSPKATGLPQVFDSNLGENFTSPGCPTFFQKLKTDSSFQTCYPLSLLMTNSMSFFQAEKSFFTATLALDASCNIDYPRCTALMSSLSQQIKADDVCGQELTNANALVQQTYNGLIAFPLLYQAGCLKDQKGNYCFATAVTNQTTAQDVYPYFLPLGTPLSGTGRPTCSTCLKNTMGIFANAAGNSTQPISKTYKAAAQQIDAGCGPNWVPESIKATGGAAGTLRAALWPVALAFAGVLML